MGLAIGRVGWCQDACVSEMTEKTQRRARKGGPRCTKKGTGADARVRETFFACFRGWPHSHFAFREILFRAALFSMNVSPFFLFGGGERKMEEYPA